ncbi:hypothetical protein GCM10023148_26400 [Actinokineospora soli]
MDRGRLTTIEHPVDGCVELCRNARLGFAPAERFRFPDLGGGGLDDLHQGAGTDCRSESRGSER